MLGGLCRPRQRIYNTCAGYAYVRSQNIKPVSTWNFDESAGPYEDLNGFMTRADAVAESLLESGITAMKIWPFDPAAIANDGLMISPAELKTAIEPFEKIRRAVGGKIEIMVELHSLWNLPMAKKIAKWLEPYDPTWYEDPIRMNSPQALAELARSTPVWICASETLGSRFPYKDMLDRDAISVVMADLCWTGGLTEGRKIAAMAETYHRPFAPHDCVGPVGFIAGIHASFSQPNTLIQESVRAFYTGWYKELGHHHAGRRGWLRAADGGTRARHRAAARRVRAVRSSRPPVTGIEPRRMLMKAAVIHAAHDLRVEEAAAPSPGAHEVLVRVRAGGICGSDLHYYHDGGFGAVRPSRAAHPRSRIGRGGSFRSATA